MGFLIGRENIARATNYHLVISPAEAFDAFEAEIFDLIVEAYSAIKTSEPIKEKVDETLISVSLYHALRFLASSKDIALTVTPERHEITDEISSGVVNSISSKRYDIYFENWNSRFPVEYGIEAKLLIGNNFANKLAKTLIREYVGEAGMHKFINGLYKKKGCMVGYIIEGDINNIVIEINKKIESLLDKNQCLAKDDSKRFNRVDVYKSAHPAKLQYPLYHLMLAFN